MHTNPHETLLHLLQARTLSEAHAHATFHDILTGLWDHAQIAALLALITSRGPTIDELVGGARAMRAHVTPVPMPPNLPPDAALIDTCGTGGAPKAFNVSTIAAIVTAAAAPRRVLVAKHGSKSRTGRGSAELLAALGVNIDATPAVQSRCLADIGLCFSFAINHHPAMLHAAPSRKSLGFPTIFNLLGPLTNPAAAPRQLLGTYSLDLAEKVAHTLARLGTRNALVVTSHDGFDELTTTSTNALFHVRDGQVTARVLDATTLGLARASIDDLRVDSLDAAADLARRILAAQPSPAADVVLLNAAAALVVAEAAPDLRTGLNTAREAIEKGRAARVLDQLVKLSHEP